MRNQNYAPLQGFAVRGGTSASLAEEATMAGLIESALHTLHYPGDEMHLDALSLRQAHAHEMELNRVCTLEDMLSKIAEAARAVARRLPSGDIRLRRVSGLA